MDGFPWNPGEGTEGDTSDAPAHQVAVVGAGFSGVALVLRLLREALTPPRVLWIERGAQLGAGAAYSARSATRLLNVPAGRMSLWHEHPDDFQNFAALRLARPVGPLEFLPRGLYRDYLVAHVRTALRSPKAARLEQVQGEAVHLTRPPASGLSELALANGESYRAEHVVLATGNGAPTTPTWCDDTSANRLLSAWREEHIEQIGAFENVLVVGSGLSLVDVVLDLLQRGHRGSITAVSRTGRLPAAHRIDAFDSTWDVRSVVHQRTARGLLRQLRVEITRAAQVGIDWRTVFDALRPHHRSIWRSLPHQERARFLARLGRLWDIHRHRMPPQAADLLSQCMEAGQLRVRRGSPVSAAWSEEGWTVDLRDPAGRTSPCSARHLILATGLDSNPCAPAPQLLRGLCEQGILAASRLGLGFATDSQGFALSQDGDRVPWLHWLGAARREESFESIAVPELRHDAYQLAVLLSRSLKTPLAREHQ